jgi:hypothetical protein
VTAEAMTNVLLYVLGTWGRPMPEAAEAVWRAELGDYDREPVEAALRSLAREGREHPPTWAQVANRADQLTGGDLDADQGWALVQKAIRRHGGDLAADQREAWLQARSPQAAAVARLVGWDYLRGTSSDDYHEPSVRRAFRDSWEQSGARERAGRALGGGGGPRRLPSTPDAALAPDTRVAVTGGPGADRRGAAGIPVHSDDRRDSGGGAAADRDSAITDTASARLPGHDT